MCRHYAFLFLLLHCMAVALAQTGAGTTDTVSAVEPTGWQVGGRAGWSDAKNPMLPVVIRTVPAAVIDSLRASDDYWYANSAGRKKVVVAPTQRPAGRSLFQQGWFRNLLWTVILSSFCGVVFWYLVSSNVVLFRRKPLVVDAAREGSEGRDTIFDRDYDKEIEAATVAGDFRLAVRLLYLQTLKELSTRRLINYQVGRTNLEYAAQLRYHPQHAAFLLLTQHFEYTWYGRLPLSADAFHRMQTRFAHFKISLQS